MAVADADALRAGAIYLVTYLITSLGVFGVMAHVSSPMAGRDLEDLGEYRGLFWQRPYVASILIAMLLSLAGVPLTAGFIGKFVVIGVGVQAAQWWLVGGIVLASAIGAYYYLRVIGAVLAVSTGGMTAERPRWVVTASGIMLLLAFMVTLWLGVYPQPLFEFGSRLALP